MSLRSHSPARLPGLLAVLAVIAWIPVASGQELAGCAIFPPDSIWNVHVDSLPLDAASDDYVDTIGATANLHPDFGSGEWPPGSGAPIGIPWVAVPAGQTTVPVSFLYDDESDPGPYPVPPSAPIEGGPAATGDRHVLVLQQSACTLYELFDAFPESGGASWSAGSGAIFDLGGYALRPESWTSADAAGLPILPGLVRYDEVESGAVEHALRFTAPQTRRAWVWPARHYASSLTAAHYPPMGQRFRLRADFDLTGFSARVQVILRALQRYGMMLADNGSAWFLSGTPDERWDNDELRELREIQGSDFEAVDVSSLMSDPDSARAAPPVACDGPEQISLIDHSVMSDEQFAACREIVAGPGLSIFGPHGSLRLQAGGRVVFSELAVFVDGMLEVALGPPSAQATALEPSGLQQPGGAAFHQRLQVFSHQ